MLTLLAVTVAVVAGAGCYLTVVFNKRIGENAARIIRAEDELARSVQQARQTEERLRAQADQAAESARRHRNQIEELIGQHAAELRATEAKLTVQAEDQVRQGLQAEVSRREQELQNVRLAMRQGNSETAAEAREHVQAEASERQLALQRMAQTLRDEMPRVFGDILQPEADQWRRQLDGVERATNDLRTRASDLERLLRHAEGKLESDMLTSIAEMRQYTRGRVAALEQDARRLRQAHLELRRHVQLRLKDEVVRTRISTAHRILPGSIQAQQPAATDILPLLYESLPTTLPVEIIYRDLTQSSWTYYLIWRSPGKKSPESQLGELLTACPSASSSATPGLVDLQCLALALHNGGPAAVRLGPLILARTADQLLGGILADDAGMSAAGPCLGSPDALADLLGREGTMSVNLTRWAEAQAG